MTPPVMISLLRRVHVKVLIGLKKKMLMMVQLFLLLLLLHVQVSHGMSQMMSRMHGHHKGMWRSIGMMMPAAADTTTTTTPHHMVG